MTPSLVLDLLDYHSKIVKQKISTVLNIKNCVMLQFIAVLMKTKVIRHVLKYIGIYQQKRILQLKMSKFKFSYIQFKNLSCQK